MRGSYERQPSKSWRVARQRGEGEAASSHKGVEMSAPKWNSAASATPER